MMVYLYVAFGVLALIALLEAVARGVSRKLDRLLEQTRQDGASIITKCMMREGAIECPGVAQVVDGQLLLTGLVESKRFSIPLSEVTVRKEATWWGRGKRWGKHAFHLDTPNTKNLILAVKEADDWRKALSSKAGGKARVNG